jgi:glycosyltransferase involved in cell wall biosynthesis
MKILVSAFAFAPNVGSEPGVGWRWAIEFSKNHFVTVITDSTREQIVKAAGVSLPDTLRVIYFRPKILKCIPLNSWTASGLYAFWQFGLFGFAKRLHRKENFDIAIHLTYSVFRHPSFLGLLGVPFIFGPLGGGEDAPWQLKKSIAGREKAKELLRSIANSASRLDPFLWLSLARSSLILTSTPQTRDALPWPFRKRAVVYPNLGTDLVADRIPTRREPAAPLRVVFAGRLLGWKGVHFALRATALAESRGVPISLSIVGKGPYEATLRELSRTLKLCPQVNWLGHVSQETLFQLYADSHCFLFPSLHDSGGTVILEAQSYGLPIICLDLGGPATLVSKDSSIVVSTASASEEKVVDSLATALAALWADEDRRQAMSSAAVRHAQSMNWSDRVNEVLNIADRAIVLRTECRDKC